MRRIVAAFSVILVLMLSFTFLPFGVDGEAALAAFEGTSTRTYGVQTLSYTQLSDELKSSNEGLSPDSLVLYFPVNMKGANVTVSSLFGVRDNPLSGTSGEFHTGIDFAAPAGTELQACISGIVVVNRESPTWGNTLVILDPRTHLYFRYAHMLERSPVAVNSEVREGQFVGKVGSTGQSTGNHLHFEIYSPKHDTADGYGVNLITSNDVTANSWIKKLGFVSPDSSNLNYVVSPLAKGIYYRDTNFPGANLKWKQASWKTYGEPVLYKP